MYKYFIILFFSSFGLTINATVCVDKTFKEEHINLYLCQNSTNYREIRTLLFKKRVEILNNYIDTRIKSGLLQNKRFEIQLYDPSLTNEHISISQNKKGYFISFSEFATIQQLKTFIDYFANKDWKPFFTSDNQKVTYETLTKQINDFFLSHKTSTLELKTETIWSLDTLKINYINDSLKYFIKTKALDINLSSNLPIKIKERFLLFESDYIYVLQNNEVIKKIKIKEPIEEDYDIYTTNHWVNICNGGEDNWIYSYSYKKNYFYKINKH